MASPPTIEEVNNDQFPSGGTVERTPEATDEKIVATLESYRVEATNARQGGLNNRDDKWKENLDLYWNRYDFSGKKSWQAKETMPEVPAYVDRFAAALKEAIVSAPGGFYTVVDPADAEGDLAKAVKRATDVWLTRVGRNQMGALSPFATVFEEQMKLGAIMALSSVTTWKEDVPGGRVAIESVDPRNVWLDPTYRNLYRIRRIELDMHEVKNLPTMKDAGGNPLFKFDAVSDLIQGMTADMLRQKEELSGHGAMIVSGRKPVVLDEYIATVVDESGNLLADKALMVVANNKHLIRGPEKNPFWHGQDWLTFAPLIPVPLSVYGRSYMEDFGSVAKTFTELTNLLLDAVHISSMKAFVVVPSMLANPSQLADGITPGKLFHLEDGFNAEQFLAEVDLGSLSPDSLKMWQSMKSELAEAAKLNEIGIGQFAPNSRTSATEVMETQQSGSALIRSVAQTVETRWLDQVLDLTWKTGFQHVGPDNKEIAAAIGEEWFGALLSRKRELLKRPFTFQARGISELLKRSAQLKSLLTLVQIISANQVFAQAFFQSVSIEKLVNYLFELSNIDLTRMQPSQREQMIRQVAEPMQEAASRAGGTGANPAAGQMGQIAQSMGVGR